MTSNPQLSVVVLAAGKGTRMKSGKAKVLHEVFFAPMIQHVLRATAPLMPERTVVIVGHQRDAVTECVEPFSVMTVIQEEQLGTGHAVAIAEHSIPVTTETVMILCGDTPLVQTETLQEMYAAHKKSGADVTVMTTFLDNPTNYGRIITDTNNYVLGIIEEKDASADQKTIREINAGIYCVDKQFLFSALTQVDTNNSQGEVYLTDIVSIAVQEARKVEKYICPQPKDILGVNSRVELSQAHAELQKRRNIEIMLQGVTIQSPETVCISSTSTIGRDSLVKSGVQIYGTTHLGEKCVIGNGAILTNCTLGNNVEVGPYAVLQDCSIPDNAKVTPHSTTFSVDN